MNNTSRPHLNVREDRPARDGGRFSGVENLLAILVFLGCAAAYMLFAGLVSSGSNDTQVTTNAVMTTQAIVDDLQSMSYQELGSAGDGMLRRYYDQQGRPASVGQTDQHAFVISWVAREVSEKIPPRLNVTVVIMPVSGNQTIAQARRVHFVKTKS